MSTTETKEPLKRRRRSKRRHRDDFPPGDRLQGVEARDDMWSEQGGYVVPCWDARGYEHGFTCLGYRNCETQIDEVAGWLNRQGLAIAPNPHPMGSLESYVYRLDLFAMAEAYCRVHKRRCDIHLSPQLIGLEKITVKVWDVEDDIPRQFRVGRSTGWLPIHLEISLRGKSLGGLPANRYYHKVLAEGHY